MSTRQLMYSFSLAALCVAAMVTPRFADATVVEFQTSLGNFEVNLADTTTTATVTNFLDYVNNGAYTNSIIHRSSAGFVIQGGDLAYNMMLPLDDIPTNPPVVNEPLHSSLRGTIAMAKLSGDPNSATNQYFFNLADNSATLDDQNGGFTVFGQVVGNGMDVVDAIAALPIYNFGSPVNELPLRNYTAADFTNNVTVDDTHFVIITAVVVTDNTVDTSAGLNLTDNTLINAPAPTPVPAPGGGGGGGSLGLLTLLSLLLARRIRNR